jgi:uncharacterized membrane protein
VHARDPLDAPARHETLASIGLEPRALDRALDLAAQGPGREAWAKVLDRTLLLAGAVLVLAGVVCFFAWNWADLHRFAKLGLVAAGIVASGAGALRLGLDRLAGQVALSAAAVLAGVLLAVYGQIYQTGADAFELFRGWALLALPFALAARFPPLWAFWLAVVNVALATWSGVHGVHLDRAALLHAGVNAAAWVLWEALSVRQPWMHGRGLPRLLAAATLVALLVPALLWAVEESEGSWPTAILLAAACALAAFVHVAFRPDLVVVATALGAAIAFLTSLAGARLVRGDPGLVLLGLFLVAQVGAAVRWLLHLHRRAA